MPRRGPKGKPDMRLDDLDPTDNARDLGQGGGGFGGGGGLGGLIGILPLLMGRKMGCGTILLLAVVVGFMMFGGGLGSIMGGGGTPQAVPGQRQAGGNVACDTEAELFACRVMRSTEQVWEQYFAASGQRYAAPTINFFTQSNQSACGAAQAAMGPFYCPADQGIYLDTSFFDELTQRFGAQGDFAAAYVVGHEVGHHIQTITGISDQVRQAQARGGQAEGNALQVRMELQADCYAGVWAKRSGRMEPGDLEEGLTAANAIGDDTLQRSAGQRPVPESFTHGTSEQRMNWLRRGFASGDPKSCDTFSGEV